MQKKLLSHLIIFLAGVVAAATLRPAFCQRVGQRMSVGLNSQKEFETYTMEQKMALLNSKLDYLIQKSLPMGWYVDADGIIKDSARSVQILKMGPIDGK